MTAQTRAAWQRGIAAIAVAVGMVIVPLSVVRSDDNGKREDGAGKYAELSAEWWQWVYKQPVATNPLFDETGAPPANGQPNGSGPAGKVFFLAGVINVSGMAERTITVPAGKDLFFPVLNNEADNVAVPPTNYSVPELRALAAAIVAKTTEYHASLNGVSLKTEIVRVKSPTFSYVLPDEDNISQFFGIDVSGRIKPAVSDGYWLYIPALPPGNYDLNFGGTLGPPYNFSLDIRYHIQQL